MAVLKPARLEDTIRLGQWLAESLPTCPALRALLLRGPLGSGKTTFTRALVEALPGGASAEVASPSFTVCNHYPTTPPVLHCDLYRNGSSLPDELAEGLDDPAVLSIVEWAEYLPEAELPEEYLDISFKSCEETRLLIMQAHGPGATALLGSLRAVWPESEA